MQTPSHAPTTEKALYCGVKRGKQKTLRSGGEKAMCINRPKTFVPLQGGTDQTWAQTSSQGTSWQAWGQEQKLTSVKSQATQANLSVKEYMTQAACNDRLTLKFCWKKITLMMSQVILIHTV